MRVSTGAAGAARAIGTFGRPGGMTPDEDDRGRAEGGGGRGRLAAGGSRGGDAGAGFGAAGATAGMCAAWLAEVSRCSRSEKRCIVRASKAWRSLLSRPCSSRSFSYCASLLPAVPTHWSTALTCCPGGITPMLVTALGAPVVTLAPLSFGPLSVKAKISHSMPTPPSRMAASIAYWRCFGDRRCSMSRSPATGLAPGAFIAHPRAGSRRRWCSRRGAGCGSRRRRRRPARRSCCPGGRTPVRPAPSPPG